MTDEAPDHTPADDPGTEEAAVVDAGAAHVADRPATDAEEQEADRRSPDPEVAEHYEEMARRGAAIKGEGAIE